MKFLLLVYLDPELMAQLPPDEFDSQMRDCIHKADALQDEGVLLGFNRLEPPARARTVRVRDGRASVYDGPFAETKEVLAGYNLVEAESLAQALELAAGFPWARWGAMEVRPVADMDAERLRLGA